MKIYKIAAAPDAAVLQNATNALAGPISQGMESLQKVYGKNLDQMIAQSLDSGDTKEIEDTLTTAVQAIQQIVAALPALQNSGLNLNVIIESIKSGDVNQIATMAKGAIQTSPQQ